MAEHNPPPGQYPPPSGSPVPPPPGAQAHPGHQGAPTTETAPAPAAAQAAAAPPPTEPPGAPPPAPPADGPRIIDTDTDAVDGLVKCARCGATEISLNARTGLLRCAFCRYEWSAESADEALGINAEIKGLTGVEVGSGAVDIIPSTDDVLTFKCTACGAEVVINTAESTQARCHWCRNTLSMNQQIPNGAVPDMVLPFAIPKEQAVTSIRAFVKKRRTFANPRFLKEFDPTNVMGVYLPYMVVDLNTHATLTGQGEHQTRSYTVKRGDDTERRYDADLYDVGRDFDLYINDLTVESSQERRDFDINTNSNNIINTVMPFDVENSVRYDSNYLSGFTSERRDTNREDLLPVAKTQARDIVRYHAHQTLGFYDRGVRWDDEKITLVGQRWASAYLPVWLYSYHQRKRDGSTFQHYVAVNARTGETMGSVPVNQPKLLLVSAAVEIVGIFAALMFLFLG